MTIHRRILTGTVLMALASGLVSANTIIGNVQVAAGGTVASLTSPPNPDTENASFSGFNQAAANASIVCPAGFACSTATLYEIDMGLTTSTSGSMEITNTNGGPQDVPCLAGTCSGPAGNVGSGIGASGDLSLTVGDPLTGTTVGAETYGPVVSLNNAVTFTVPTNLAINCAPHNGSCTYVLQVASGTTSYTGTGNPSVALFDLYDSTDANWAGTEAPAYTGGLVALNLSLTGSSSLGQPQPNGIGTSDNVSAITSGQVTVDYLFSYTETSLSGVPEPTTMVLMGGALLGLGLLRKRVKG